MSIMDMIYFDRLEKEKKEAEEKAKAEKCKCTCKCKCEENERVFNDGPGMSPSRGPW